MPTISRDVERHLVGEDSDNARAVQSAVEKNGSRRIAVLGFVGVVTLIAVLGANMHARQAKQPHKTKPVDGATTAIFMEAEKEPSEDQPTPSCAAPGGNCQASHCCLDGGDTGYQCYERDQDWASCSNWCKPGKHDGDKQMGWDQWGKPKFPSWSCKEFGPRSRAGCSSFKNQSSCPSGRCEWKFGKTCAEPCNILPADACTKQDSCQWTGTACKDNCWTFDSKHKCLHVGEHSKRCEWRADLSKCIRACWTYGDNECPGEDRCIVTKKGCQSDPCSSPGEDCRETKCCSGQRQAGGMTCYQKDEYFATCMKHCDGEGWNCTKLGNRTLTQTGCGWAGEDCSLPPHLCCNIGHQCYRKDKYFAGCVQTFMTTATKKIKMPFPEGWPAHPKFLGGGQQEYMYYAVDAKHAQGTTMYCFAAYLPGSYEERLIEIARANHASIFACESHDLFHTWQSNTQGWGDTGQATLTNTDVFINVWEQVKKSGKLWHQEWTVKVDPDAIVVPDRLKAHLWYLKAPRDTPMYIKNNALNASQGNNGFLGAVEVYSQSAVERYLDWYPKCKKTIGVNSGEDGFMKGCMDAMGVGFMVDGNMFKPDDDPATCGKGELAAFHPLKVQEKYQCCIDVINGIDRDIAYGNCRNLGSAWVDKVWPDCDKWHKCREPFWSGR